LLLDGLVGSQRMEAFGLETLDGSVAQPCQGPGQEVQVLLQASFLAWSALVGEGHHVPLALLTSLAGVLTWVESGPGLPSVQGALPYLV